MNRETSALVIFLVFVGSICFAVSEEEQSSDIGNTGSGEQVHHYSNETINQYRTVTYDYATGEMTYQSDEEVIRFLEKVRRTNSSFLYSSLDQNVTGSNNSRSARVRRTVFPPDGRVLISSTSSFPYSAIGEYYSCKTPMHLVLGRTLPCPNCSPLCLRSYQQRMDAIGICLHWKNMYCNWHSS